MSGPVEYALMRNTGRLFALFLAMAAILVLFHLCGTGEMVLRLSDGSFIGLDRMIGDVKGARLIFIGESHDRKEDHKAQLEIIERLHAAGLPLAIGLEMFTSGSQGELDRWVAGTLDRHDFIRIYYREWMMPWPLYRDIFLYARRHRIPLIGLNVPRSISRKVAREGFAALTPKERQALPSGVTCSVDLVYREFIRQAYAEHDGSEKPFDYFCEAQMLWNRGMGRNLREFLGKNPGITVVVLAGVGHAMKRGIPEEVFQGTGTSYRVILPESPNFDRGKATRRDADYLLLSCKED